MNLRQQLRERGPTALAATLCLVFVLSLFVDDSPVGEDEAGLAPGEAALRAVIDPETGTLAVGGEARRLLADKLLNEDLRRMLSRSDEGLVPVVHPDGRVSVDLQGRFMNASVARIGADGRIEQTCIESAPAAAAFWNGERDETRAGALEGEVR